MLGKSFKWFSLSMLALGAFYWYEWRPSVIKKKCSKWALDEALKKAKESDLPEGRYQKEIYDDYYRRCSNEHGL